MSEQLSPEEVLRQCRTAYQITGAPTYNLAADALESQARRIAQMERDEPVFTDLQQTISRQVDKIAELEKARDEWKFRAEHSQSLRAQNSRGLYDTQPSPPPSDAHLRTALMAVMGEVEGVGKGIPNARHRIAFDTIWGIANRALRQQPPAEPDTARDAERYRFLRRRITATIIGRLAREGDSILDQRPEHMDAMVDDRMRPLGETRDDHAGG